MHSLILPISVASALIIVWIVTSLKLAQRNVLLSLKRRKSLISRTYVATSAGSGRRVVDRCHRKEEEWIAMIDDHSDHELSTIDNIIIDRTHNS